MKLNKYLILMLDKYNYVTGYYSFQTDITNLVKSLPENNTFLVMLIGKNSSTPIWSGVNWIK